MKIFLLISDLLWKYKFPWILGTLAINIIADWDSDDVVVWGMFGFFLFLFVVERILIHQGIIPKDYNL